LSTPLYSKASTSNRTLPYHPNKLGFIVSVTSLVPLIFGAKVLG